MRFPGEAMFAFKLLTPYRLFQAVKLTSPSTLARMFRNRMGLHVPFFLVVLTLNLF